MGRLKAFTRLSMESKWYRFFKYIVSFRTKERNKKRNTKIEAQVRMEALHRGH